VPDSRRGLSVTVDAVPYVAVHAGHDAVTVMIVRKETETRRGIIKIAAVFDERMSPHG